MIEKVESDHEAGLSVINNESLEEARESDDKSQDDIIRSRLVDIKMAAQEPTLSQEQLTVNARLQEEEILAMEAIYGEDVIVLDREDGFRSFQINIHIEAPGKLITSTKISGIDNEAMERADDSDGFFYSINVQYLPPIDDTDGDRRAISESVSPDVDLHSLLNYNDGKCYEKFCQNLPACCTCLSEYAGTKFIRLPCKHFFCHNCLETYSAMQAREIMAIQCPQVKCKELVPPGLVKSLLGDERFEQWESKLFHKTLDTMSDLVYCPRCDMACLEDSDHLAQCPKCFFTFCGLCRDRLHVGVQCITSEEKLNLLRNRQPGIKTTRQQRKELDMINHLLNEKEIKRIAKKCANCSMAISRISGCNHMRCTKCKTEFCYKCGEAYYTGYCMNCTAFDNDTF
ncbi:E3 ubiquitin-protein ligase RNF14-like [Papaver somniferum]|uniref:E3 ubiquitin-protein ligase RNF14-like n=1 Tax=Papaver somniferum TaxID=3469 RepID=UPI000E70422B|nr:E3 ubiquitin-protein ligase RNF14-like [Papaver somniferum]